MVRVALQKRSSCGQVTIQRYWKAVFRLADVQIGEVVFTELVLVCAFTRYFAWLDKLLRFDVRISQFYDMLRPYSDVLSFKAVFKQFYHMY